jgi:hypothetical protein
MFNLIQSATDDQTAIGACILTLMGAAVLVFASFHLGPAGKKMRMTDRRASELKMPSRVTMDSDQQHERAA